ncbi:MAG TPA: patatin-like phospholipase family protein [Jatrophihabitans sp.]|nr:patatin-like phospholipase family protein [Jatrophihabitans sp.]
MTIEFARQETEPATPLGALLDVFQIRQYFNVLVGAADLSAALAHDAGFVNDLRRAVLRLPFERRSTPSIAFPAAEARLPGLGSARVGLVASGGSGALASIVGVVRAVEEAGATISVYSLCSGGALFGFPLAAGLSSQETAELVMGLEPEEYVDVSWRGMARAVGSLGRGWAGIIRGDKLERYFRRHLGDLTLGQLRTPAYAPIWNIETNRLDYLGPRSYPDLPVARAIRTAISLPLFVEPVVLEGGSWCDGGIVDIFPVHPVLDLEPSVDAVVAINAFYPSEFAGEDESDWQHKPVSIMHVARQVRSCQHVQLARENLARLRSATDVELLEPVPYQKVRATGFYQQFIDNREWPEFIRAGRLAMCDALRRRHGAWGRQSG